MRKSKAKITFLLLLVAAECQAKSACTTTEGLVANQVIASLVDPDQEVGGRKRKFLLFDTALPVTTDGAPNAIGPTQGIGLNTICNSVTAYQTNEKGDRTRILTCGETIQAFNDLKSRDWIDQPNINVDWQTGLIHSEDGDREIPCIFHTGPYAGYYATKTNLKNGLDRDTSECSANDQIDPRVVYGLTIQGGHNFLRASGVQLGDLAVVTYRNPKGETKSVPSIVIDSGGIRFPAMGTIALNAALLGAAGPFENRPSVLGLAIDAPRQVRIVIVPGSFGYKLDRPYTNENINVRWNAFLREMDMSSSDDLLDSISSCTEGIVNTSSPFVSAFAYRRRVPVRSRFKR